MSKHLCKKLLLMEETQINFKKLEDLLKDR